MISEGFCPIREEGHSVVVLDQRLLPVEERWIPVDSLEAVAEAIVTMQVRGAPLIGIVAAYGLARYSGQLTGSAEDFLAKFNAAGDMLAATRPTAVNLFWAIDRMRALAGSVAPLPPAGRAQRLMEEARAIRVEDEQMCRRMGSFGAELIADGETIMTHCNAGALATGGWGTALGVIRSAVAAGKRIQVLARETRPLLQGARLTAWELHKDGIPVTVVPDAAAAHLMATGKIDRVITGADRIAANGDSANKIGTYELAIVAKHHAVPFHIAAPYSTVDLSCCCGSEITIEERSSSEMTHFAGVRTVADGVAVRNPAFDVTPHQLIDSIITDAGVARFPYQESLERLCRR